MKLFKISIICLVIFGFVHFLGDFLLVRLLNLEMYLDVKFWIEKITIGLTIVVFGSILWMLAKFLLQKKEK